MTPLFLHGRESRARQRELSSHGHHDRKYHQRATSIQSTPTEIGRRTRIVQPSPFGYIRVPSRYDTTYPSGLHSERLPSWFTSRSSRYPYSLDHPSTSISAAEIAHRSLAHDLHTFHDYHSDAYSHGAQKYSDRYATYYPSREPDYSSIQKKENNVRVQRRSDELPFLRKKWKREENNGWRKTEKEVEWRKARRWM